MTRINCLPPHTLLDQHLLAHLREGLRPINNILNGKSDISKCPGDWKLGTGHEIFCRKHSLFTLRQWLAAKEEYDIRYRDNAKFLWAPSLEDVPRPYINDYTPTYPALRQNLSRLIKRWRASRGSLTFKYTFRGKPIDNVKIMRQYVSYVKSVCHIYRTQELL